ncbi:MAG: hypothetical protein AAFP82_04945 [Bacteroidota bacterium]
MCIVILACCSLTKKVSTNKRCINEELVSNIKNDLDVIIEKRISTSTNTNERLILSRLHRLLDRKDFSALIKIVEEIDIDCDRIETYSIIESFIPHTQLYSLYITLKTGEKSYHVYTCDMIENKIELLGITKRDYFGTMAKYCLPYMKEHTYDNYILFMKFTQENKILVDFGTDYDIWRYNQFVLLEEALFNN